MKVLHHTAAVVDLIFGNHSAKQLGSKIQLTPLSTWNMADRGVPDAVDSATEFIGRLRAIKDSSSDFYGSFNKAGVLDNAVRNAEDTISFLRRGDAPVDEARSTIGRLSAIGRDISRAIDELNLRGR